MQINRGWKAFLTGVLTGFASPALLLFPWKIKINSDAEGFTEDRKKLESDWKKLVGDSRVTMKKTNDKLKPR